MLWEDQYADVLTRQKEQSTKVPIVNLASGTKIIMGCGRVARITGHKTSMNVQVQCLQDEKYYWLSKLARVDLAK